MYIVTAEAHLQYGTVVVQDFYRVLLQWEVQYCIFITVYHQEQVFPYT